MNKFNAAAFLALALALDGNAQAANISRKAQLGRQLFFDTNLSTPPGQACATCHDAGLFFRDPDQDVPTSEGASPELKGSRNTPTALYTAFIPKFHFDKAEGLYVGGQFLDGRAATLKEQAKGPFLNPLEMDNPDKATVVGKVKQAEYAPLFLKVYGRRAFDNTGKAYDRIAEAIAAFERTRVFAPFTSKYDYYLAGKTQFTEQERRGRQVFEAGDKGNCAACHPDRPGADGTPPLFTDHTYDNIGIPKNPDNPFYALPKDLNPEGSAFVDKGLGGFVKKPAEDGKFKVQTLRNIAKTPPYMHNGYFKTLRGVVDFYNTRDIKPACPDPLTPEAQALAQGCWPAPEMPRNVNHDELGALNLTEQEVDDLVAFLQTLTDGYQP
ncbi:Cytochrome c [Methylomagnum ishizawai]|uniref:Cytochrome c n=1 Tax=Methylomagnum ishizawai TaxID=1760988 RepID=A0A1Y6D0C7_9GAMM|nr:cytochrome c peroxidase [Methylomagnum ishizawai]SMF94283.1 Cytochrome c [Methylomagnum ishizawai]